MNHAAKEEAGNRSSGIRSRDNRIETEERDISFRPRVPKARPCVEAVPNIFHTGGEEKTIIGRSCEVTAGYDQRWVMGRHRGQGQRGHTVDRFHPKHRRCSLGDRQEMFRVGLD